MSTKPSFAYCVPLHIGLVHLELLPLIFAKEDLYSLVEWKTFVLPFKQHLVIIHFSSISFSLAGKNSYTFALKRKKKKEQNIPFI